MRIDSTRINLASIGDGVLDDGLDPSGLEDQNGQHLDYLRTYNENELV